LQPDRSPSIWPTFGIQEPSGQSHVRGEAARIVMLPGAELPKKVVLRRIESEAAMREEKKSAAGVWLAMLSTNCELVRARRSILRR